MRQSTLGFGRSRDVPEESEGAPEEVVDVAGEDAPNPQKRARRQASKRSEEISKRQMQMTIALNGKLHRHDREAHPKQEEVIIIDDEEVNAKEREVKAAKKKRIISPGPSTVSKPMEPISLSVKGNLGSSSTSHTFFLKRPKEEAAAAKESILPMVSNGKYTSLKQKFKPQMDAPWPDSGNIHVQPEDTHARVSMQQSPTSLRNQRPAQQTPKVQAFTYPYEDLITISSSPSTSHSSGGRLEGSQETIVRAFIGNNVNLTKSLRDGRVPAAVLRLQKEALEGTAALESAGLWVDQYRPTRAEEVLGNEKRSVYLRDWLEDLRVKGVISGGGKETKRIERRKKRVKKVVGLDDFIVDDEEEEQAWFDQFRKCPQGETGQQVDLPSASVDENPEEGRHLSNAIILSGPTGSGKTAAVYACAAELGFEVFEVYAGFGKRSGKDVTQAVGDLGRNHMVSSGGQGGGATWKGPKALTNVMNGAPRQSLILLEEVDLLFEEDKGFWAAIVELISTSRRPVVMTCNDLSCIPLEELPIQDVLVFESPSAAQTIPFLQTMALCQGHLLSPDPLEQLYNTTRGSPRSRWDVSRLIIPSDGPLHPSTVLTSVDKKSRCGESSPDLRQAIMQLQFYCQREPSHSKDKQQRKLWMRDTLDDTLKPGEKSTEVDLSIRDMIVTAERRSFCDAYLNSPFDRACEILEPDGYASSHDDVQGQGTVLLFKARVRLEALVHPSMGPEWDYQEALLSKTDSINSTLVDMDKKRIQESARIDALLTSIFINPTSKVPSWESVVDYAPMVGNMIFADDEEEAAYNARIDFILQEAQQEQVDGDWSWKSASLLQKIGIRPSRHSTRLLLEKGSDGLLALGKREADFHRWILVDEEKLEAARQNRLTF
ncbi:hypothetical protein CBS101457_004657 [Exobasidium rhododendri]|nr:hypothetical protein CBS101457_004657 [Exobasidium rhododendri]